MKKITTHLILSAAVLAATVSTGFSQSKENLSLEQYLELAEKNNPAIKAAEARYLAMLENVPQVGSLPNLEATMGIFPKPMALVGGDQLGSFRVMQMFPWFGTLSSSKEEANEMAKATYELYNAEKADLFFRVKSSWHELIKINREIALVEENIGLLESMERILLNKYQSTISGYNPASEQVPGMINQEMPNSLNNSSISGMNNMENDGRKDQTMSKSSGSMNMGSSMTGQGSGLQDILRMKMEILDQQSRLLLLKDQLKTEQATFNAYLNRDINIGISIGNNLEPVTLPADKSVIIDSIMQNNPMLAMLEKESIAYEHMGNKASKMGAPMFGAGLEYMLIQKREGNTFMMNGKDMWMPMVSVSIPIYRKKYDAMRNEARLKKESSLFEAEALENELQIQYSQWIQALNDADRRMALYKEQEDLARRATDLLLTGFSSSGTGFEEVLRMQYKVNDYGQKYIEAVTDYNTSVAYAEKLMNTVKK